MERDDLCLSVKGKYYILVLFIGKIFLNLNLNT